MYNDLLPSGTTTYVQDEAANISSSVPADSQVGSVGAALLPEGAKGLVFDCDGTLLDSMQTHFEAWRHTCRHFGIKLSAHTMVALAGE